VDGDTVLTVVNVGRHAPGEGVPNLDLGRAAPPWAGTIAAHDELHVLDLRPRRRAQ
jgi:hypothetical protein